MPCSSAQSRKLPLLIGGLALLTVLVIGLVVWAVSAESGRRVMKIAANPSSRLAQRAAEFFCGEDRGSTGLEYTECGTETMMDLISGRQYDMGFLFLPEDRLPAFSRMAERRRLVYRPLQKSDLVVHCGPPGSFYGIGHISPEELSGCRCIQFEDDFFSLEELLNEHPYYRSGRCSIERVIRTNSDHLMLDMLRSTDYCNIGSYWIRESRRASETCRALIEGFEGRVAFGCLFIDTRPLSSPAADFLKRLRDEIK